MEITFLDKPRRTAIWKQVAYSEKLISIVVREDGSQLDEKDDAIIKSLWDQYKAANPNSDDHAFKDFLFANGYKSLLDLSYPIRYLKF